MAVIESIMVLYAKEVVTSDRVVAAVQRFHHKKIEQSLYPANHEEGLLLWISNACDALKSRIEQECNSATNNGGDVRAL